MPLRENDPVVLVRSMQRYAVWTSMDDIGAHQLRLHTRAWEGVGQNAGQQLHRLAQAHLAGQDASQHIWGPGQGLSLHC